MSAAPTLELGGLPVSAVDRAGLVDAVFEGMAHRRGGWIVTANTDLLRQAAESPEVRQLFREADWIVADGMPLLWAARVAGRPLPERVAGSDLVRDLAARAAANGRRLFLLGGEKGVAETAAARLREAYPGLQVVGVASPQLSSEPTEAELEAVRDQLAVARPDLVYVAFGAPKQERVIRALRPAFPATWWMGCGISLSFVAGRVRRAPRWMQRSGLEWVHRLAQEPGRLWRRYLHDVGFAVRLLAAARRRRHAAARAPVPRS
jgi:N-acetylglucosaminyldiphosphoundecaprenol N-acetyl-beta-D-mannosaminyltransferase